MEEIYENQDTNEAVVTNEVNDKLPDGQLYKLLSILFPYGHSNFNDTSYVGPVPCYGNSKNIMEVNVSPSFAPFSLILHSVADDVNVDDLFGFYAGVVSIVAPELKVMGGRFNESSNVLSFEFRSDEEKESNPWKDFIVFT